MKTSLFNVNVSRHDGEYAKYGLWFSDVNLKKLKKLNEITSISLLENHLEFLLKNKQIEKQGGEQNESLFIVKPFHDSIGFNAVPAISSNPDTSLVETAIHARPTMRQLMR